MSSPRLHEDWPHADKAMWTRLISPGAPLDERGALAHVRATTLVSLQMQYRHWLRWLQRADPAALVEPPETRLTLERLRAWLEDLAGTRPMTRLAYVLSLIHIYAADD